MPSSLQRHATRYGRPNGSVHIVFGKYVFFIVFTGACLLVLLWPLHWHDARRQSELLATGGGSTARQAGRSSWPYSAADGFFTLLQV